MPPTPQSSFLISHEDTRIIVFNSSYRIQPCLFYKLSFVYSYRCHITSVIRKTICTIKIIDVLSDLNLNMYFKDFWHFITNCRCWFKYIYICIFKYDSSLHLYGEEGGWVSMREQDRIHWKSVYKHSVIAWRITTTDDILISSSVFHLTWLNTKQTPGVS